MTWTAKLLVSALFLWSGVLHKPRNFRSMSEMLEGMGFPFPSLCVTLAITLEVGGVAVLLGPAALLSNSLVNATLAALTCYTLLTAILFHDFWRMEPPKRDHELAGFLKNVGLCGAFMLIVQN